MATPAIEQVILAGIFMGVGGCHISLRPEEQGKMLRRYAAATARR